mmetsp:Transcript_27109/g.60258  ORF Transcript_27109/g.60258 Transcript_27109/m.60258 type:complete len:113 (-) Transcript_27109:91-429(-)
MPPRLPFLFAPSTSATSSFLGPEYFRKLVVEYVVSSADDIIQADPTNPLLPPIEERMELPAAEAMDVVEDDDDDTCPTAAAAASEGADSIGEIKPINFRRGYNPTPVSSVCR